MAGLTVRFAGGTDGRAGGEGPLVILLHGFGAPGDDLASLADELDAPSGTRYVFPEGPLSLSPYHGGGGRAWWLIDPARIQADRTAGRMRDLSQDVPPGLAPARRRLADLLDELPRRLPVDYTRTIIGGFSQGAMLSCDTVLRTAYPFAGLVQLSGTLLAKPEWAPLLAGRKGLPVFQSHGSHDEVLPFLMAERLRDELEQAGLPVQWRGFRGGHEIPPPVIRRLGLFLRTVTGR